MGVRRRGRGDRAQVARVPLPADAVPAARDRRGGRDRPAGDARDAARVSRQRAHARLRNAVHVRRRAARRADHPPGGEVEIALPPGAWYDLNSRQRFPGQRVLRYQAALDQFPVFGREGYALPLGRAVQHTGEIDAAKPLEQLWVFGKPTRPLDGFAQANIVEAAGRHVRDRRGGRRQGRALRRRGRNRRRQAGAMARDDRCAPPSRSPPASPPASARARRAARARAIASARSRRASSSSATATCSRRAPRGSASRRGTPITMPPRFAPRRRTRSKSGTSRSRRR